MTKFRAEVVKNSNLARLFDEIEVIMLNWTMMINEEQLSSLMTTTRIEPRNEKSKADVIEALIGEIQVTSEDDTMVRSVQGTRSQKM